MKNINLGAHFLFLLILCSIKIERLLFLKFLKILAFFDSYFWPFYKSEEKIKVSFVISVIMPSIWNVFIKFRWHDEKLIQWCINVISHSETETKLLTEQSVFTEKTSLSLQFSKMLKLKLKFQKHLKVNKKYTLLSLCFKLK